MTDPVTPNLGLTKPTVGADADAWGALVNGNADLVDAEWSRTARGDAGYAIAPADRFVCLTAALTAPRSFTLPAASALKTGQAITVLDEAGGGSANNTLSIVRAGADTINGASSLVLNAARASVVLRSDGVSKWTADTAKVLTGLVCSGSPTLSGGQVLLTNGTSNAIVWNTAGFAAPAFTTRSAGTKLVLYPNISGATVDFGFGVEAQGLWSSVADATQTFYWYAATTRVMTLQGTGALVLNMPSTAHLQVGGGTSPNRVFNVDFAGRTVARYDDNNMIAVYTASNLAISAAGHGTGLQFFLSADSVTSKDSGTISCRAEEDYSSAANESSYLDFTFRMDGSPASGFRIGRDNTSFRNLIAASDGVPTLGGPGNRWSTVYAVTGAINTSDARQKAVRGGPRPEELRAWAAVRPVMFRWAGRPARESGGEGARLQVGYVAQDVEQAFADEGLDAGDYGLWVRDALPDGSVAFGLRYDQCLVLETAALRDRLAQLEARLATLEGGR